MTDSASRRRKRSRLVTLTTLTALGAATLGACGNADAAEEARLSETQYGPGVDAYPYQTLAECKADNKVPDAECDRAQAAAWSQDDAGAPRFESQALCEDQFGNGECTQRSANGTSFFTPLLAGFVIGQMLDGGRSRYYHSGLYRDRRRDVFYTGGGVGGGWIYRDPRTGVSKVGSRALQPPVATPRVQTRSSVVSRGGFGGRAALSSSRGGGWGGGRGG